MFLSTLYWTTRTKNGRRSHCLIGDELHERRGRDRLLTQVSLKLIAALRLQKVQLFSRFDPFRNDAELEAVSDGDDVNGNSGIVHVSCEVANERLVNLEGIYGHVLKVLKRGIARPEVIYRYS